MTLKYDSCDVTRHVSVLKIPISLSFIGDSNECCDVHEHEAVKGCL